MKKQDLFILLAAGAITVASCSSNNSQPANNQAQIDSLANVKANDLQMQQQAKNDSIINAMAKAKADSIEAATPKKEVVRTVIEKEHSHRTDRQTAPPNTQPGTSLGHSTGVNDRPGATQSTAPTGTSLGNSKNVNDRPGATQTR